MADELVSLAQAIRAAALAYPEAWEDHPWGETVVKVRKKVFIFMGAPNDSFGFSLKLPQSAGEALEQPDAAPTGYGLGRAGWVSITVRPGAAAPLAQYLAWLDESYRAVAPRKLIAERDRQVQAGA